MPSGALCWPAERTLSSPICISRRARPMRAAGRLLPPYDTRATLTRMEVADRRVTRQRASSRWATAFTTAAQPTGSMITNATMLVRLGKRADGSGSRAITIPSRRPGSAGSIMRGSGDGGLVFRHEPLCARREGEIAGHLHPCKSIVRRGRSLRRRCFATDGCGSSCRLSAPMPAGSTFATARCACSSARDLLLICWAETASTLSRVRA